jgi:hypothetical protein
MMRISRNEIVKLARYYVLANTANSLFWLLRRDEIVARMERECSMKELADYYDFITSRGKRTELEAGLAYGLLVASLMMEVKLAGSSSDRPDASRLRWGEHIRDYARAMARSTQYSAISSPAPSVIVRESPGSYFQVKRVGKIQGRKSE